MVCQLSRNNTSLVEFIGLLLLLQKDNLFRFDCGHNKLSESFPNLSSQIVNEADEVKSICCSSDNLTLMRKIV